MQGLTKLAPGPGHVALAERPEREPGPGEVLLEVVATGICGTDLHIEAAEYPSLPPVTMGHEVSAVVAAVGAGVALRALGQRHVARAGGELGQALHGRRPPGRPAAIRAAVARLSI